MDEMKQFVGFKFWVDSWRAGPEIWVKNESKNGLRNEMYTIAMARTNDPDSATSQFFINLEDNYFLDKNAGYCVFGKVIEGQEVVKEIGNLSTHVSNGMGDVPIKTVTIKSIKLIKKGND